MIGHTLAFYSLSNVCDTSARDRMSGSDGYWTSSTSSQTFVMQAPQNTRFQPLGSGVVVPSNGRDGMHLNRCRLSGSNPTVIGRYIRVGRRLI